MPASKEKDVTGVQPLELANTFHGGFDTTASMRTHCC